MKSHPARGAWIEMQTIRYGQNLLEMSHPARGAWIEISRFGGHGLQTRSHPARGAWIEIKTPKYKVGQGMVAPRTGCVD